MISAFFSVFLPGLNVINFKPRILTIFSLLFFGIIVYLGREYFENGLSFNAFILFLFLKIFPGIACFNLLNNYKFNLIIFLFLSLFFLLNVIFFPNLIDSREFFWFPEWAIGNSTNYVNVYALLTLRLVYLSKKSFWNFGYFLPLFYFSILWDNRTGIVLAFVLFFYIMYKINKLSSFAVVIFCIILYNSINNYYLDIRFLSLGLDSVRWLVWDDALYSLLNHNYFYGGFSSNFNDTIWMHNLWLDIYRLAGVYSFYIALLFLFVIPLLLVLVLNPNYLLVFISSVSVAFSSVPLEGSFLEFVIVIGGIIEVYNFRRTIHISRKLEGLLL